jgi:hypothetical protein
MNTDVLLLTGQQQKAEHAPSEFLQIKRHKSLKVPNKE